MVLQGGWSNCRQTVDGTDLILIRLPQNIATGPEAPLDSLKIHVGKYKENITQVRQGTTIQTTNHTWSVIGLYLKNSNGRNYSRVAIAR